MSSAYRELILTYNESMFESALVSMLYKITKDVALNHPEDAISIQFKDAEKFEIDNYIDERFRRTDNQYIDPNGNFIYRWHLFENLKPFCKEVQVSVISKVSKNNRDSIDIKKDYDYPAITNMTHTISICDEVKQ